MAVKVKLDSMTEMVRAIGSKKNSKRAADILITEMKRFILKGISPVLGKRRFVSYKDPDKYPGDRKPKRPVNMKLTGDMLNALKFKLKGDSFEVGWYSGVDKKKANNHNTGDTVPERRLLPSKKGERFNASITRTLRNYYANVISDIIKRAK